MKKTVLIVALAIVSVCVNAQTRAKKNKKASSNARSIGSLPVDIVNTKSIAPSTIPRGVINEQSIETAAPKTVSTATATVVTEEIPKQNQVIQETPKGTVNWTTQYIEAKGESVIDTIRFKNPAQARAMATRGAVVVAQRNLLEIINGVNVVGETKVQDMITTSDYIYTRVDGLVKGAEVVGEPMVKYGMVEVKMRIPLYSQNGLASAVQAEASRKITSLFDPTKELKDIGNENVKETPTTTVKADLDILKNLAFDFKGQKIDPSLFPVVLDKDGKMLLDMSKIYNVKDGKFPKIIGAAKELMDKTGFKKGTEILDVIETKAAGQFVISDASKNKINWKKLGGILAKIGSIALLFL